MSFPIPAWPDSATPEGATFFANARAILAAWADHGLGDPFALGMLAQAEAESSLDPNAKGDYPNHDRTRAPTAFGLYQWHAPRLAAIKAGTGIDVMADVLAGQGSIQTQIEAAWWELNNAPCFGMKAIESQATAYGAALQACVLFERAGALDAAQRRGRMAERWAVYASGRWPESGGPVPAGWTAS